MNEDQGKVMNTQGNVKAAEDAEGLHDLANAVDHAAPSSLVLILKDSNGQWDTLPL